uniref:Uncharacterized protein n=1 Tax=Timema bartmani TaxID=61472 RepID=A0A7R9F8A4_9NEOP|nr:unnamed protein product [Timema bartmani]
MAPGSTCVSSKLAFLNSWTRGGMCSFPVNRKVQFFSRRSIRSVWENKEVVECLWKHYAAPPRVFHHLLNTQCLTPSGKNQHTNRVRQASGSLRRVKHDLPAGLDEPDSSDYEEKIVKTEMKHYNSSPGVRYSGPDHFTLDLKSQIKLEQIQYTLSSRKSGSPTTVVNPRLDRTGDDPPPHYSCASPSTSVSASGMMTCNQQSSQLKLVSASSSSLTGQNLYNFSAL